MAEDYCSHGHPAPHMYDPDRSPPFKVGRFLAIAIPAWVITLILFGQFLLGLPVAALVLFFCRMLDRNDFEEILRVNATGIASSIGQCGLWSGAPHTAAEAYQRRQRELALRVTDRERRLGVDKYRAQVEQAALQRAFDAEARRLGIERDERVRKSAELTRIFEMTARRIVEIHDSTHPDKERELAWLKEDYMRRALELMNKR